MSIDPGVLAALPKDAPQPETGADCVNSADDDGDGLVNEGCPKAGDERESGQACRNDTNDDTKKDGSADDDVVNDGCPVWFWVFPPDNGDEIDLEAIYGAPIVSDDTVYFGAYDGNVYALDAAGGSEIWRFGTDAPIVSALGAEWGGDVQAPALRTLLAGSGDGRVYALAPEDGRVRWSFDTGDEIWASPLVAESVFVSSVNGKLYALDPENRDRRWVFETDGGLLTDPVLADKGTLIAGGIGETLYAIDSATGEQKWSFDGGNWFWGKPLAGPGVPVSPNPGEEVPAPDTVVYAPNLDGKVYSLNLRTGQKIWEFDTTHPVRSAPVFAAGVLVVVNRNGEVYGVDPAGRQKWGPTLLNKTVLADPLSLSDDSVMIVATGGDLFRIDPNTGASSPVQVQK